MANFIEIEIDDRPIDKLRKGVAFVRCDEVQEVCAQHEDDLGAWVVFVSYRGGNQGRTVAIRETKEAAMEVAAKIIGQGKDRSIHLGSMLEVGTELMLVKAVGPSDSVVVVRGAAATQPQPHEAGEPVVLSNAD